jgi:hypothetical protein
MKGKTVSPPIYPWKNQFMEQKWSKKGGKNGAKKEQNDS